MVNFSADEYFLDIGYLKKFYSWNSHLMKLWTEIITLSLLKKGNLDIDTLVSGWIGYTDTQKNSNPTQYCLDIPKLHLFLSVSGFVDHTWNQKKSFTSYRCINSSVDESIETRLLTRVRHQITNLR